MSTTAPFPSKATVVNQVTLFRSIEFYEVPFRFMKHHSIL